MLTELTRVDLSSDPDYSYEEMGPSSLSSPLSSDSAFGDQLTCSVELVSLNYLCNGDWALERGGVNLVKTIDSVLILIFFIIRSPHIEQKIGEAWWRGFFLIMRLTFLDGVLILLFNVITSILFYQNEGKGMWVPSPINMHCKFAVSFHWKGFGRQSSFCCFFFIWVTKIYVFMKY